MDKIHAGALTELMSYIPNTPIYCTTNAIDGQALELTGTAPAIVAASIKVLEMVEAGAELRDRLWSNARLFREKMSAAGFTLAGADHAIIPVMLGDAVVAQNFARELQKEGIYVTGFFFPVVPKGQARIRTQMSAAHSPEQIERAVEAFTRIGKQLGVIA
jgi:glycine C-acetyltransferase